MFTRLPGCAGVCCCIKIGKRWRLLCGGSRLNWGLRNLDIGERASWFFVNKYCSTILESACSDCDRNLNQKWLLNEFLKSSISRLGSAGSQCARIIAHTSVNGWNDKPKAFLNCDLHFASSEIDRVKNTFSKMMGRTRHQVISWPQMKLRWGDYVPGLQVVTRAFSETEKLHAFNNIFALSREVIVSFISLIYIWPTE